MKILTENDWKHFFEKNNGLLFESLTLMLLQFLHPNCEWKRTPPSWDGKRDFFTDISKDNLIKIKHWVECKCWSKSLSIDAIAATLVVGVAKDASIITFFSYSPLTENTKKYLALFKQRTSIQINIYDDYKLEDLILLCYKSEMFQDRIIQFFPSMQNKIRMYTTKNDVISVRQFFTNPYGNDQSKEDGKRYYRVNDLVTVNYMLENLSVEKEAEITIESGYSPLRYKHLKSLNSDQSACMKKLMLLPSEITILQYVYKISEYKKNIQMPILYLQHCGKYLAYQNKTLICKWLADTPLIGSNYIRICDDITRAFKSKGNISASIDVIYGSSGTGKSRLIREISDNAILEGYKVFRFNGEYKLSECIDWLRSCVSALYALPQLNCDISTMFLDVDTDKCPSHVTTILYDKSFNIFNYIKDCVFLLIDLAKEHNLSLFFDNVQFFDDATIEIIDFLVTQLELCHDCNLKLILGFNTDFLFPKMDAKSLFSRLQLLHKDRKGELNLYFVDGFTEGQAEIYIRQCLLCDNLQNKAEFNHVIKFLIQKTSTLPVAIEQTLFYLEQRGAIEKINSYFIVNDLNKFHQTVRDVPPSLKLILAKRWEIISQNIPTHDHIREYLCVISLLREAKLKFLYDYHANLEVIDNMVDIGLLKQSETGAYILYHSTVNIFFTDIFKKDRPKYTPKLAKTIEEYGWKDIYPAQFVISKGSTAMKTELMTFAVNLLLRKAVPKELQMDFNYIIETSIFRDSLVEISSELLDAICIICYHGQVYEDYKKAVQRYEHFFNDFWSSKKQCLAFGEIYAEFTREYSSLIILLREDILCINLVDSILHKWEKLEFSSKASSLRMYGLLLTRKCAALKSLNRTQEAIDVAEEGLKIAESISDDELYIRICFDYGYIYYNTYPNIPNVCIYWGRAFDKFEQSSCPSAKKMLGKVYFHMTLVHAMNHRYEEALSLSDIVLRFFEMDTKTPYHDLRIYLLRAIIAMICPQINISAKSELDKAEDLCIVHNSTKVYFKCLSLKAKYFFLSGDNDNTSLYAQRALIEIYKFVSDENIENKYEELIYDLFFMFRLTSQEHDAVSNTLDVVFSLHLKKKIHIMINQPTNVLVQVKEEYRTMSCMTDPERKIYFIQP